MRHLALALALAPGAMSMGTSEDPCVSTNCDGSGVCTFTATVDPFAGPTGYYKFAECGDMVNPVIGLTQGVTYKFDQADGSNWYHPLGFAYFADGAHTGVDELEPGISQSGSSCVDDNTCQAPMYYKDGAFAGGAYDNQVSPIRGGEDFGLDNYEPEFFYPKDQWVESSYAVHLTITDATYDKDIFYFCHIHAGMSGRVKVMTPAGAAVSAADDPALPADYYGLPSAYDEMCGTYGLDDYEASDGACSDVFVCNGGATLARGSFGDCLRSMDCAMDTHMRTTLSDDPVAAFMHQMIPHHNNAINMAKLLLKQDALDVAGEGDDCAECEIEDLLWSMIVVQGHQVITMEDWLDSNSYDASATCDARRLAAANKKQLRGPKKALEAPPTKQAVRRLDGHNAGMGTGSGTSEDPCMTTNCDDHNLCTFTATIDPHAGPSGYYKFDECGDVAMPVLGLVQGITYKFSQADGSNWYHPLGFAYFVDGAHEGVDELEPGISQSGSACVDDNSCQAPMYYKDGIFAGVDGYDNSGASSAGSCYDSTTHVVECDVAEAACPGYWYEPGFVGGSGCCHCTASCDHADETSQECTYYPAGVSGGEDFGLDAYEPEFFLPKGDWLATDYDVRLTITDEDYDKDLIYFCHIHSGMSGRIKVMDKVSGAAVSAADDPAISADYYNFPSAYDASCGGYDLEAYQESNGLCDHETFICTDDATPSGSFGDCLKSMDCAMDFNMRTILSDNDVASFMHQMIPHHENAVNMAKLLMREDALDECTSARKRKLRAREGRRRIDDDGGCPDQAVDDLLWDIVSSQTHQILTMQGWLADNGYAQSAVCDLNQVQDTDRPEPAESGESTPVEDDAAAEESSDEAEDSASTKTVALAAVVASALAAALV
jgi:uncharacterized protein (DUF305 family)